MHSLDTFITDLPTLERAVAKIAAEINVPKDNLPTLGYSRDGGYPHIEMIGDEFHWVIVERGQELKRKATKDSDEILYWIFETATFSMAFDYELKHRIGRTRLPTYRLSEATRAFRASKSIMDEARGRGSCKDSQIPPFS